MKYKRKIKLKLLLAKLFGVAVVFAILTIAYFQDKFIEILISIVFFYIFRPLHEKQFHSSSIYKCGAISIVVYLIMTRIVLKRHESILVAVILTYLLTKGSNFVRDVLDNKILLNNYRQKLSKFECTAIENLSEDELRTCLSCIPDEVVRIVYGYIHRPKELSAVAYAMRCHISEATLYRYLRKVKSAYKDLS